MCLSVRPSVCLSVYVCALRGVQASKSLRRSDGDWHQQQQHSLTLDLNTLTQPSESLWANFSVPSELSKRSIRDFEVAALSSNFGPQSESVAACQASK